MNRFDPLRKVMHVDEAVARYAAQPGLVFTDGVFDVLHRGLVAFLAEARQLGERLVVAVHADTARGAPAQPMTREGDRAFLVAALESVDTVVVVHDTSPLALIARLRPAVYVQRGEQDMSRLAETALMHSWGGHAIALPFADGLGTDALAQRIRGATGAVAGEP